MFLLAFFMLVAAIAFSVGLFRTFALDVPANTVVVTLNRLTGRMRSFSPGLHFHFRWLEYVVGGYSTMAVVTTAEMDVETKDEAPIPIQFLMEWRVDPRQINTYISFKQAEIDKVLVEQFKAIASIIIRKMKDLDEVFDGLGSIAQQILEAFTKTQDAAGQTLEAHYGIIVSVTRFSDPKVPKKIAEAKLDLEAMRKTNEKKKIEMETANELRDEEIKSINKVRGKEMTKLKSMAAAMVKTAAKQNPPQIMDLQTAMKVIQTQLGVIKESNSTNGLNRDTLSTLEKVLPGIVSQVFGRSKMDADALEKLLSKTIKEALDGRK